MIRYFFTVLLLGPLVLGAQDDTALPLILGRSPALLAPTVDGSGGSVVFGATINPEGAKLPVMDLYAATVEGTGLRRLTELPGGRQPPQGATGVSVSPDGARAAFTALLPSGEQVHVVEIATGTDRIVAVDTEGCIQPLEAECPNCFFACLDSPHISPDGSKVLYLARRQQPFYLANADGSGQLRLPAFSGALAPAPQRVISGDRLVVFTSAAPFGPTFAPSARDVYVMNLDGSGIRAVTSFGNDAAVFARHATIGTDSALIAFESNRDPETGTATQTIQVWVVGADGSGLRPLTTGSEASHSPSLSADGSLVAFVRDGQLFVVRTDGTDLRALTNFRLSSAREPVVSNDGSRVVFTLGPRDGGPGAIYSIHTDGSDLLPVYAPPALNPNGITGVVAGARPSPGSLISAYGLNLAADALTLADGFPLPESLAGVSLLVNGRPAPLLAVTPWQVNAQLPPEILEGPVAFQFRFADGTLAAATAVEVKTLAPAIFILASQTQENGGSVTPTVAQAAAFHAGTSVPADPDHPAVAGEALEIYGLGLGPTEPFVPAGIPAPASPPSRTLIRVQVLIGDQRAEVLFAGLAPSLAGIYQVNAIVPAGLRPGQHVLRRRVGGVSSFGFGTITVR